MDINNVYVVPEALEAMLPLLDLKDYAALSVLTKDWYGFMCEKMWREAVRRVACHMDFVCAETGVCNITKNYAFHISRIHIRPGALVRMAAALHALRNRRKRDPFPAAYNALFDATDAYDLADADADADAKKSRVVSTVNFILCAYDCIDRNNSTRRIRRTTDARNVCVAKACMFNAFLVYLVAAYPHGAKELIAHPRLNTLLHEKIVDARSLVDGDPETRVHFTASTRSHVLATCDRAKTIFSQK